jgi:hypothetical protein
VGVAACAVGTVNRVAGASPLETYAVLAVLSG